MRLLWVENYARFVAVALPAFLQGHDVRVVPSVAEARQELQAGTFDAVLLDYDLDDGKGSELVPLLLSLPERPLIIAASSHADGNARLMEAGADQVCGKMEFSRIGTVLASGHRPPA